MCFGRFNSNHYKADLQTLLWNWPKLSLESGLILKLNSNWINSMNHLISLPKTSGYCNFIIRNRSLRDQCYGIGSKVATLGMQLLVPRLVFSIFRYLVSTSWCVLLNILKCVHMFNNFSKYLIWDMSVIIRSKTVSKLAWQNLIHFYN